MNDPFRIKKVLRDYKIWPNTAGAVVECISNNTSTYEAIMSNTELELALYIKNSYNNGGIQSKAQLDKLVALIDAYGETKYTEGADSNLD